MAKYKNKGIQQKIINEAARLIMRKGASHTSLSDIAKEVGISKGTLYYYYPSKPELIFDITERHMYQYTNDIIEWIKEMKEEMPPEKLLSVVYKTLSKTESRGKLHIYLIQEAITNNRSLLKRFREIYKEWTKLLEQGLIGILGDGPDNKILAKIILTSLDGVIIQSILGVKEIPLDKMTKYLISKK